MDHYFKGKNEEQILTKESIPFDNIPENYAWTEITGSSRVRNMIGPLCKQLRQEKVLVLSGSGSNTSKVVTLGEIIKRRHKNVQQRIEVGERAVQEYWEPKDEEEGLDTIVVTRRIPTIHFLLDINKTSSPVASPDQDLYDALWKVDDKKQKQTPKKHKPKERKGEKVKSV